MTESTASISLNVFDDGPGEGPESFTYTLLDGETYDVDADNSSFTITVDDTPTDGTPVVSLAIEPDVLSEEDSDATLASVSFNVVGDIPEGGLSVLVTGSVNILDQVDGAREIGFNNATLGEFFDPATGTFEVLLTANSGSIDLPILNDIIQEADEDFTFTLVENDGSLDSIYAVDTTANTDTFTLVDGNGGPGVGPTVSLSVSETELSEGDSFTVNFNVDGDIPDGGLTVLVDSPTPRVLGEFNIFNADGTPAFESDRKSVV